MFARTELIWNLEWGTSSRVARAPARVCMLLVGLTVNEHRTYSTDLFVERVLAACSQSEHADFQGYLATLRAQGFWLKHLPSTMYMTEFLEARLGVSGSVAARLLCTAEETRQGTRDIGRLGGSRWRHLDS